MGFGCTPTPPVDLPVATTLPPAFDCYSVMPDWSNVWTVEQQQWCCSFRGVGCKPSAPTTRCPAKVRAYDCSLGPDGLVPDIWPDAQRTWCCVNNNIGCAKSTTPCPSTTLPPPPKVAPELDFGVQVVVIDDLSEMPPIQSCKGHEQEWTQCDMPECDTCNPRDCLFTEWNDWTVMDSCTGLCTRKRTIMRENNECGAPCAGVTIESVAHDSCMPQKCGAISVDCKWEPWADWSCCSDRHQGQSYRLRLIEQAPQRGGKPCTGAYNQTRPCDSTSVDCQLSDWGEWTVCTCTCGTGYQSRMRRVVQAAVGDGGPCEGVTKEAQPCAQVPCVTAASLAPCRLTEWSSWRGCEQPGGRQQMRQRELVEPDDKGVMGICNQPLVETTGCPLKTQRQPQPCAYAAWSAWSACTDNCQGHKTRSRSVIQDPNDVPCFIPDTDGVVDMDETTACECKHEVCEFTMWAEWSECSHRCGIGITTRERKIERGHDCKGCLQEVKDCQKEPCQPLDCVWADWDDWATCTCTCGGGTTRRSRVVKQSPRHGGKLCQPEEKSQVAPCNTAPCDRCVDGAWGDWEEWSKCTATCSPALRVRHRYISRFPNHCGKPAIGLEDEYQPCADLPDCSADQDCELGQWGEWSGCTSECFGLRERSRRIKKSAIGAGKPCAGQVKEISPCNPDPGELPSATCAPDAKVCCKMAAWEEWHPCTATCDGGQRLRYRQILAPNRDEGRPCEADLAEVAPCNTQPCESTVCKDCEWGQWSEWGECSACGNQRFRHRAIEKMPNGCGKICDPGRAKETGSCESPCVKNRYCVWTSWAVVTECGKNECGYGVSTRQRDLTSSKHVPRWGYFFKGAVGLPCEGTQVDHLPCEYIPCNHGCQPLDCHFSAWTDWSPPTCTQLCERQRSVETPNACGGNPCMGQLVETKRCIKACQAPEDCVFGEWQDWSECTKGTDQIERVRHIKSPPSNGGQPCYGPTKETVMCASLGAVKDAVVDEWQAWSHCTVTCGGGTRTRARQLKSLATPGGSPFSGPLQQLEPCQILPCPNAENIPCLFGEWGQWGPCHENGLQVRRRKIAQEPHGRAECCHGSLLEIQSCSLAVDCVLSPWAAWDDCDKSCGGGQQQRHREVMILPKNGGKCCPKELMETRGCASQLCVNMAGLVSDWSDWGECSAKCGDGQVQRSRHLFQDVEADAIGFAGALSEFQACEGKSEDCEDCVDCLWAEWSQWTVCSNDCDGGQHKRKRGIQQVPLAGCKLCDPLDGEEVEPCNTQPCHKSDCIDGLWDEWREWEACSMSCAGGLTWRSRPVAREANHCGKPALGPAVQHGSCNADVSCNEDRDCKFDEWREWGACSQDCGGIRCRSRLIAKKGRGDGAFCEGCLNQTEPCDAKPNCAGGPPTDCVMGGWSAWGECDVTCGNGQMVRRRDVLVPGGFGGKVCTGDLLQTAPCILSACEGTCEPRPCHWGEWEDWGACDQCNGERRRFRHIVALAQCGGRQCEHGAAQEISNCTRRCHDVSYCVWGQWEAYGACSASCGRGMKSRSRFLKGMSKIPTRMLESTPFHKLQLQQKFAAEFDERDLLQQFEELVQQTRHLEKRRVQELVLAWAVGSLSLLAASVAVRAWLGASRAGKNHVTSYEHVPGTSASGQRDLALSAE